MTGHLLKFTRKRKIVPISPTTDIVVVDKNGYIGEKRPNGNTVYYCYLDSLADYSQAGLGQVTIIPVEIGKVTIGGREYKTTKIGSQEWLAENLDWKFPGLIVGASGTSTTESRANYYNNDEATYGVNGNKYGLLYNWIAVSYLEANKVDLIPGWHVPTYAEFNDLATVVGGISIAGTRLKSTTSWPSGGNGIDSFDFGAFSSGGLGHDGNFNSIGQYGSFWTITDTGNVAYYRYFGSQSNMYENTTYKSAEVSLRLVKDAT